jgi:hypothetical protein
MSVRNLARLRAQQELPPAVASDSDTASDEEDAHPQQLAFNPFDLIQDDEDSASEADADAAASPPQSPPRPAAVPQQQQRQNAGNSVAKSRSQQKAGKAAAGGKAGRRGATAVKHGVGEEADLDQLLKELDMAPGQVSTCSQSRCLLLHASTSQRS